MVRAGFLKGKQLPYSPIPRYWITAVLPLGIDRCWNQSSRLDHTSIYYTLFMHANYSKLASTLGLPAVRLAACFSLSLHEAAEPPCPWHLSLQFPTWFLLSISTLSVTSVQSLRAYRVLSLRMHQKPITESPQGELVLICVKQSIRHGAEGLVSSPALRLSLGPTSHGHERESGRHLGQWLPDCKQAQVAQEIPRCSAELLLQCECFETIFL